MLVLLLLLGCPKQAPSAATVEADRVERVQQLKAEAPVEERARGLWRVVFDPEERAFFEACRRVLADPATLDAASEGLDETARTYVQARAEQTATADHYRPVFADPESVGLLLKPERHEWFAGGYVFREGAHALRPTDAQTLEVALDQATWTLRFTDVDHLELTDDLGAFAWLVGHEGPLTLERAP